MSKNRLKAIDFKKLPINGFKTLAVRYEILKDQETGVLYYFVESTGGPTMTPIIDANGKPVIDKSE